jgi:cytoskeletal protein CcmA (bactofilin family)
MKHIKRLVGVLLLAVVPVFALVSVAHAQRFATNVDEGEKVHSSLYSSGNNVSIKGEIFGDVFCAGRNVVVDATVHGDVICAGQDVTVNGKVDGDIRVAGQTVNVAAEATRNATVAAGTFSLDASAKVGQDLTATGDTMNVKGEVGRDAVISGTKLVFNGPVGRNVSAKSENITFKKDAAVAGNLTYTGSRKPAMNDGAHVAGATKEVKPEKKGSRFNFSPIFYLFFVVSALLIMLALVLFFPRHLQSTTDRIMKSPTRTLLIGAVASVLMPAVGVGLAVTIVGIPLTILLLLALIFAAMLSGPIAGYFVGRLILRNNQNAVAIALTGGAILFTSYFLPVIGIIFLLGAFWFGFGALLQELWAHSRFGQTPVAAKPAKAAKK